MSKFLLYIWQLPQNIIGLFVILFSRAKYDKQDDIWYTKYLFGVSLGKYIIISNLYKSYDNTKNHERGHQKQSLRLGWLYLLLIGLPSATFNLWDRLFHEKWTNMQRELWYYNLPWEHSADKLGGVKRFA